MAKVLTKSQIIQAIADAHKDKLARKDVARRPRVAGHRRLQGAEEERPLRAARVRQVRRRQEARHQGAPGDQPVHQGADDLQGEAGPQGAQGPPGQGRQGRSVRNPLLLSPPPSTRRGEGFIESGRLAAMVRLNRIYTKAGDGGDTRLVGGQKVRKDALRIEAYGTIDELSACIGLARTALLAPDAPAGADALAACAGAHPERAFQPGQRPGHAARGPPPEAAGDRSAPRDRAGDTRSTAGTRRCRSCAASCCRAAALVAAYLHLARTVCRRAERLIVRLRDAEPIGEQVARPTSTGSRTRCSS